jgi:glycerol-3-phosphate acyltransferase PlsY
MDSAVLPLQLVAGCLALLGGYLLGSIPLRARIGRVADLRAADGDQVGVWSGAAAAWQASGSGWGLLVLAGDLARGLLPVALAGVTWSWWAGWAAGLGAVAATRWPLFGRLPGGRDPVVLAGVSIALSPLAGLVSVILALAAAGVTRALGGRARFAALVAGFGSFAVLALVEQGDATRVAAILILDLAAALPSRPVRH